MLWVLASQPDLVLSARIFLGLILVAAGFSKMASLGKFAKVVLGYELMPQPLARILSKILPFIEVFLGAMLLGDLLLPWSAIGAGGVFFLFSVAVGLNLLRGRRDIPCGCFSVEQEHQLNWWMVVRNGVFVCLAAWIAFISSASLFGRHWLSPSLSGSTRINSWSELFCTSLMAVSVIALWSLSKSLLALSRLPDPGSGCNGCGG